uniref:Uncharacterized protein n=2 Tax=Daphnia magna TaxID=35525 RepID=A0A0P6DJ49_9CRUS
MVAYFLKMMSDTSSKIGVTSPRIKMKFAFVLLLVIFVTDVTPILEEVSDIIFKKYATMKIMEDCYGKEAVNNMLSEVALAYARCRGKPSFLPILEQIGSFNLEQASEEPQVTQTESLTEPLTDPPTTTTTTSATSTTTPTPDTSVKQVPYAVYRPPAVKIPQEVVDQYPPFGYDDPRFWLGYFPPNRRLQFQQRFPYGDSGYYYGGPVSPGAYRWKRAEHRTLPEDNQEIVEELPVVTEGSQPTGPFAFPFANNMFSKHEAILGNATCVMKEIGFIGDDMQPNYSNIRKRIDNLPVTAELKADLIDGIETCQQFTSCIPTKTYSDIPVLREMVTPYAFFKCFKGRKIEACMKKDLREKFVSLLTGLPASRGKQMRDETASEVQANMDGVFNMIYGFDMNSRSTSFF